MTEYSAEVVASMRHLASMPQAHVTMTRDDVKAMLLGTGGNMLARGTLYDFKCRDIGAGVYKVTLEPTHP